MEKLIAVYGLGDVRFIIIIRFNLSNCIPILIDATGFLGILANPRPQHRSGAWWPCRKQYPILCRSFDFDYCDITDRANLFIVLIHIYQVLAP